MTKDEKKTIIKSIAAVAWADGNLDPEEVKYVEDTCVNLGELEKSEIDEILNNTKSIEPVLDELKKFDIGLVGELLSFCYRMAHKDKVVSDSETAVIKRIAALFWSDLYQDMIINWLKASYSAEDMYFELFVLPKVKIQKAS